MVLFILFVHGFRHCTLSFSPSIARKFERACCIRHPSFIQINKMYVVVVAIVLWKCSIAVFTIVQNQFNIVEWINFLLLILLKENRTYTSFINSKYNCLSFCDRAITHFEYIDANAKSGERKKIKQIHRKKELWSVLFFYDRRGHQRNSSAHCCQCRAGISIGTGVSVIYPFPLLLGFFSSLPISLFYFILFKEQLL